MDSDGARGRGGGRVRSFKQADLCEVAPGFEALSDVEALRVIRRAVAEGTLDPLGDTGWSPNTWVDGLIAAIWTNAKTGAGFRVTHLELGTGNTGPVRTNAALNVPVAPRKAVTDIVVDADFLRTSTFLAAGDFVGSTLREGGLWSALTGGSLYNHLLWSTALVKTNASAIADVNLQLSPV